MLKIQTAQTGWSSRVFNSVIRLDGILFSFECVIRRCKFDAIDSVSFELAMEL